MTEIKKGDFIELMYTGKTKEGQIFDTTNPLVAKELGGDPKKTNPVIICIGQNMILPSLENFLDKKQVGKYSVELSAIDAFGKKDPKLIQLVSASKFKKDNVNPYPGMPVTIDGKNAEIKRVGGGRVLVDFNHPLSGKDVSYDLEVLRVVTDTKEKVDAYIVNNFGNIKHDYEKDEVIVYLKTKIPEEISKSFENKIKEVIPEIKSVTFKIEAEKVEKTESNL